MKYGVVGLFVPAKTPNVIVMKIHADAVAALTHHRSSRGTKAIGAPSLHPPRQNRLLLASETEKVGVPIVKAAGIKAGVIGRQIFASIPSANAAD